MFDNKVIFQTGTVFELRRSQGWRTREHISCHQALITGVWRLKMSRTSLVQAEWPVEFKRDFNVITREPSNATLLFSLVIIEPSNWSIKSVYKRNQVTIFWGVQGRFLNRFNRGPWRPDPWHTQPVSNSTDMKVSTGQWTTPPSSLRKRRREERFWTNF